MKKQINIIVKLNFPGIHSWNNCNLKPVIYLKNYHRHMFHITCKIQVKHDDRDIEIIMLKNSVLNYLNRKFYSDHYGCGLFGNMSCEMIAEMILEEFKLNYCRVLEDNENGAEVKNER